MDGPKSLQHLRVGIIGKVANNLCDDVEAQVITLGRPSKITFQVRPVGLHYHQRTRATDAIELSSSAHEAFRIAKNYSDMVFAGWDQAKVEAMRGILRAKVDQHEYVRRKLLETGKRILIEDSWRDDFWGWGPGHNGQNMLGLLWMEVRDDLRGQRT